MKNAKYSNDGSNDDRTGAQAYLRPEAKPFSWKSLYKSQRVAFSDIIDALIDAVADVDRAEHDRAGYEAGRSNHTVLLSGDRGMGKTSLMYSLQQALDPNSDWLNAVKKDSDWKEMCAEKFNDSHLSSRIIWLQPLDMEALHGPTNLFVAILARIEQSLQMEPRNDGPPTGLLNPHAGLESAIVELRRLTTDASLTWDGNFKERAENLDPDSYAQEVRRTEYARLSLNTRLNEVLNQLAKSFTWDHRVSSPLFVFPIDDFDLNPTRCLELLRLLRALAVPRLFTLVLGDFAIAEHIFKLKMVGDFAKVADIKLDANGLYDSAFYTDGLGIASHAIRKLLPPGQRILLRRLTVEESLDYRPDENSGTPTLKEVLSRYIIELETPYPSKEKKGFDSPISNAAELLLTRPIDKSIDNKVSKYVYSAIELLRAPPREIADLWFTLMNRRIGHDDGRSEFARLVRKWLKDTVTTDQDFPYEMQQQFVDCVRELPGGDLEFHTENFTVEWAKSSPRRWVEELEDSKQYRPRQRYQFFPHRSRRIEFGVNRTRDGKELGQERRCILDKRSENHLVLLHDLIALGPRFPIAGNWLTPELSEMNLADVTWHFNRESLTFPWMGAIFRSFWGFDRFIHTWNSALDVVDKEPPYRHEIVTLAVHWMTAGISILTGEPYPWKKGPMRVVCPDDDYDKRASESAKVMNRLIALVANLIDLDDRDGRWRRKNSLFNFAVLLCPEYGLPRWFCEAFWDVDDEFEPTWLDSQAIDCREKLNAFWAKHHHEIRLKRAYYSGVPYAHEIVSAERQLLVTPHVLIDSIRETLASGGKSDDWSQDALDELARQLQKPSKLFNGDLQSIQDVLELPDERVDFRPRNLPGDLKSTLQFLLDQGSFVSEMLTHPANVFQKHALCPTYHELLRRD